jgi:hypothetical protein
MDGLGRCCVCEQTTEVTKVILLNKKAPLPGRGWGCSACLLSNDGAVAVVCSWCFTGDVARRLRFACRGHPATDGRVPIGTLNGAHHHDGAIHRVLTTRADVAMGH